MLGPGFQPAAGFDDFLAWILVDLLDAAGPGALDGDDVGLAWEDGFILEVG